MSKKNIAIITARGGSKRIPNKNIKDFCGKPIIAYSIEAALKCGVFDEVMVSTDSEQIAEIALSYGAKVPFMRSKENSGDFSTTEDVVLEVIKCYEEIGKKYDYACCLYPTAPFVSAKQIEEALLIMQTNDPAVVIPVVQFSYPPQRCFIISEDGYARFKYPEHVTARSQDLEKQYHDAGQFYIYNVRKLIETKGIITDDFMPIIIPEMQVQDIDTYEDWKIAEIKYKILNEIME